MIYWIFGNSGAGKTTLAKKIIPERRAILLDGDDLRTVWTLGFSRADRYEQNLRAARLAKIMQKQVEHVIVTTICPYEDLRRQIDAICQPFWIYLPGGQPPSERYPFEEPKKYNLKLEPIPNGVNEHHVDKIIAGHT